MRAAHGQGLPGPQTRLNPLTYRGGNRRIGGRGRPYSEPNRDQGGGKGKKGGIAPLRSPGQSAQPQNAVAQTPDGQRYARQWLLLLCWPSRKGQLRALKK